ncbi:MAG: lysophospholipid acyltransferase family protein [Acidimicrobiales bacterium]
MTGTDYDTDWARRYPTRLARALVLEGVARPLINGLASPQITGDDRIAHLRGPVIFAANHASHIDTPLMLASLPSRFRHRAAVAAGADYFFDKRWKGAMWAFSINAIPIERARVSPASLRLAQRLLDENWSLVIFPEGGRSPHGWAQPHKPGASFLALRAGVPIVPVHLEGTRRILRKGRSKITPSRTHVTFGAPIHPTADDDPRALADRVERAIEVLADEQASDWWTAKRHAAQGRTPSLVGPQAGEWRKYWSLGEGRRRRSRRPTWP